ncbi:MAG: lipopolysaccharide biosynthesis protein [Gammaproteobacteria bacterium]|nr:lipopolysaccharide biosynthesis protein [Gammaproteobacteria bacterium]
MAKSAAWMVLFKFIERSLGLVSTVILARLLLPSDFGVVAMALSFITMAEMLTAFGFDIVLIHKQDASVEHYHTAWTGNVLLGGAITCLMLAMAVPIAGFYQNPEVFWVVVALAFGPLLSGCDNIGVVIFRKELDFRREFKFQLSRKLAGFLITVPLAVILRNYWALVVGILFSRATGTAVSYLMHPFRPRFSLRHFGEFFHFSRWLLLNNILIFIKERSTDFFIGRINGAAALGVYNISYEFANLPTTEISAPINRALLPSFARMGNLDEITDAYRNAIGMLALLALPAAAGIFAVAGYLVPVVFGQKWLEAIPLMKILVMPGVLFLAHSSISAVLIGRGFPGRVAFTNGVDALVLLGLLAFLPRYYGVTGAAYAVLIASLVGTPLFLHQVRRCLGVRPRVFAGVVIRPMIASLLMAALVRWLLPADGASLPLPQATLWLLVGVATGMLSYGVLAAAVWRLAGAPDGPERILLQRLRELLGRSMARLAMLRG